MKKLAIILALLMIPSFAFALDTISDSDLNDVTGQAGVSILINSISIVKTGTDTTGYGDADGSGNVNWLVIQKTAASDSTLHVGFHGSTPLMIDIMDPTTLSADSVMNFYATVFGATVETVNAEYIGQAGVEITLPDMIEIQRYGLDQDIIYLEKNTVTAGGSASVAGETELIRRFKDGNSTTKIYGDPTEIGSPWMTGTETPQQTKIIITTHEDHAPFTAYH